jgi:peptidoglycan/LPS O-acetylase OafA/YrhL
MQLQYSKRVLAGWPSVFLDGIRFLAAFVVLLTHCRAVWFPEGELDALPSNISHGAVVLFFVLSGFVIAHTTSGGTRSAKEYAVARLSRLYSVFLPAIGITIVCALLVRALTPSIYEQYNQSNVVARYLISVIFCNELWFFSSAPLINGPIWSLGYEFWYYAIFGAFFYKRPGIVGYFVPLLVCLIAGPKILMLMLMWLVGWLAYHLPKLPVSNTASWSMMIILLLLAGYLIAFLPSMPNPINTTSLHWADKFITDFIASIIIGTAFWILPTGKRNISYGWLISWFRKLADLTFAIYVLHFPLLVLSKCLLSYFTAPKSVFFWVSLLFVFSGCSIIGTILEKNRKHWSSLFNKLFYKVERLVQATALR